MILIKSTLKMFICLYARFYLFLKLQFLFLEIFFILCVFNSINTIFTDIEGNISHYYIIIPLHAADTLFRRDILQVKRMCLISIQEAFPGNYSELTYSISEPVVCYCFEFSIKELFCSLKRVFCKLFSCTWFE